MEATREEQEREATQVFAAARASLLMERPFLGILALQLRLQPVWDSRVPTAATDGTMLWFRPDWLLERSDDDRYFVLAHEVWHCALAHFSRSTRRDAEAWNIAFDHEVNALLVRDGLSLPNGAVLFRSWMDKNAEQVYNLLQDDFPHGPSRGALADVHVATVDLTPGLEVDPRFQVAPVMDEERRAVWRRRVAGALQQAQRQGMAPCAEVLAVVREVLHPRVPWRRLLESHVRKVHGGASTWLPPNRRAIHRGLYLPGRRESALRAVVAIDTSGSTHCFLPTFLSELSSLLRTFARTEVTVLCCDTELAPPQILDPFQPLTAETLELRGGGGTDLRPPFAWAAERMPPDVLVYLTDGDGPAPKRPPPFPVLWVLTPSGVVPAPWGEVAVMDVDDADLGLLGPGAPVFGPPGMLPGRRPG